MPTVAQRERAALADLLDEVGPDRTTLCEGWDTADLLLHLLLRERRPDALLGTVLPMLKPWTRAVARRYERRTWAERVELLRTGPRLPNPVAIPAVDRALNTGEYFIHHEDVRRGSPGWAPRALDAATTDALVGQLTGPVARWRLKKLGVGVSARLPDGRTFDLLAGEPRVTLIGAVGELVLWTNGRRACEVDVEGSPEAVGMIRRATRR